MDCLIRESLATFAQHEQSTHENMCITNSGFGLVHFVMHSGFYSPLGFGILYRNYLPNL